MASNRMSTNVSKALSIFVRNLADYYNGNNDSSCARDNNSVRCK